MRFIKVFFLSLFLINLAALPARAEMNVVASIKPIHSLVAGVMKGVASPGLIMDGAGSPHTYAMKPSQAHMLEKANLIFWVGEDIEAFLEKPLMTIGAKAKKISLLDAHGLQKLKFREGGNFESHAHDEKEHDEHKDHGHKEHKDHGHKKHKGHDHGHDKHEKDHAEKGHDDHGFDPHVWLDPIRAKALVHEIEEALVELDPAHKTQYQANAAALSARLDELSKSLSSRLKPVTAKRFIVFHDAYHYFEKRFGLKAAGSITVSPEVMPGAERIKKLRGKIKGLGVTCVFAEPQFEPKLVNTITQGTQAKSGVLDPIGADLKNGPELYFKLIGNMADAFVTCLSGKTG